MSIMNIILAIVSMAVSFWHGVAALDGRGYQALSSFLFFVFAVLLWQGFDLSMFVGDCVCEVKP